MSEQKQPKAGEWWETGEPGAEGLRVFIVGIPHDGVDFVCQEEDEEPHIRHLNGWRHLPDCDSFDWMPETFLSVSPPAPKKIPVRLWVSHRMTFEEGADYPVRCGDQPPSGPGSWAEIHHSPDGFYLLADQ
jgi:hypothetical protein